MEDQSPGAPPGPDEELTIVGRRERRLRKLQCPGCGLGRLPDTRFCPRCGVALPEIPHEESPEAAEQKRPRNRALNWFVDLVPGALSPRILAACLVTSLIGGMGWRLAFGIFGSMESAGQYTAVFTLPLAALLGGGGLTVYVTGLSWLLYGQVCNPVAALADLRMKHWLVLVTLTVIGLKLFSLIP